MTRNTRSFKGPLARETMSLRIAKTAVGLLLAALLSAGCTPPSQAEPLTVDAALAAGGQIRFDRLAEVLAAAVDDEGRVEATALVVKLPALDIQLAGLACPWPDEVAQAGTQSDARLAWLYNARTAWSLRIVARELRRRQRHPDQFDLPETIAANRLLDSRFPLNGAETTLGAIDRELAEYGDFRVAASAPGATDFFGQLPQTPFAPADVGGRIGPRFDQYITDSRRVVVDQNWQRLELPPALHQFVDRLVEQYNHRYDIDAASVSTALAAHLDARGRDRMEDALGHEVVRRPGPPGIVAKPVSDRPVRPPAVRLVRPPAPPGPDGQDDSP